MAYFIKTYAQSRYFCVILPCPSFIYFVSSFSIIISLFAW